MMTTRTTTMMMMMMTTTTTKTPRALRHKQVWVKYPMLLKNVCYLQLTFLFSDVKSTEKKKLSEKIKEKEELERKEEELKKAFEESKESDQLTSEEELAERLRVQKLQEDSDLELAKDAFGVANNVTGIDAMSPTSKDDFTEFEKLLKDKILPYEKSIHYSSFLESLFRDLCLSLEVEDLKKINNSLTVLLSEKQRQEKQSKGKKKKKGVLPGGGLKAKMKDDLADYGEFDGGYVQEYEDFM
uniref:EIF3j n=1 Tax=Denticeps clupeoides TaxID=299321 RepID=A0AAY4CV36_9TELE